METDYTGYISWGNDPKDALSLMGIIVGMALGNSLHFSVYHDPDYCENTLAFTVFGEHGDIERFCNNMRNDVNLANMIKTRKEFQLDFLLQKTDPAKKCLIPNHRLKLIPYE